MNQERFDKSFKGCLMSLETDNKITGKAVDFEPDGYIVLDTGDALLKSYPVEQLVWASCWVCGSSLYDLELAALPNGDTVYVCPDHVCEHGKISIRLFDKDQIEFLAKSVKSNCHSPYLEQMSKDILTTLWEWEHPCYTCYTTY